MDRIDGTTGKKLRSGFMAGRTLVLGDEVPRHVPARVERIIRNEQDQSEILISLVQIAAIVFFYVFYAVSPKAFPPDVPFEPIPVALGVYGMFTLYRLLLAIRHRLTPMFLQISVVADISMLMVTIWSFHLQYSAPPEIYLKAPTLMYVFIMIALRSLRFEPRYVLVAGGSAALGWAVLVAYAALHGDESMITKSFATYVTSHSVLIGAEVDKIVSILMVTAILALALHRARKLLLRAATEQQAAADLSRFFAPEVAGKIRTSDDDLVPGTAELREAAILFIDMRGFTNLSAGLRPAEVMTLLSDYQALMVAIIRRHGGSVDKFMGDGILASFGATEIEAGFARNAANCIEQVIADGETWRHARAEREAPAPSVAAALTTGMVMIGTVGDADRLEYTVIGEPVNLAAKLEKHCKVEKATAVMPAATLALAREQGYARSHLWETRPERRVEGVETIIDLVVLTPPVALAG